MRWKEGRRSSNIEDRRGRGRSVAVGGGIGVVLIAVLAALLGKDPTQLLQLLASQGGSTVVAAGPSAAGTDESKDFVSVVLADTEDVWKRLFRERGASYREPTLVLFTDAVESACGVQGSAVGPFYCPSDEKVYLDLTFFAELSQRLGAPGDFAQAYVIAHEIGHHVQNLFGTSTQVRRQQQRLDEVESNQLSVRLELQADFYAGVWAHHAQRARQVLEQGDIEEAMNAAAMIGDDHLQRRGHGHVAPESFTHGTSEQRMHWFRLGLETGDADLGDTFSARGL